MDLQKLLERLAQKRLEDFSKHSWNEHARAIHARAPRPAGETDCFQIDGVWFEVGDTSEWLDQPGGDIRFTALAYAPADESGPAVRLSIVIERPRNSAGPVPGPSMSCLLG